MTISEMSRKKLTMGEKKDTKICKHQEKGVQVQKLRAALGLSVKEFAKELSISDKTLYRYESGERRIPDGFLRLAKLLTKSEEPGQPKNSSIKDITTTYIPANHKAHVKKIAILLQKTLITLESKTDCGFALEHNINAFYAAVIKEWETKEDPTNDKGVGDNSNHKSIRR
jgi:DNA-binding transcriptional regulator YiaG